MIIYSFERVVRLSGIFIKMTEKFTSNSC